MSHALFRNVNKNVFELNRKNDTMSTQVTGTYSTYLKTGQYLSSKIGNGSKILNFGAGLDQTKQGLLDGLVDKNCTVDDFEPHPAKRSSPPEYTDGSNIPSNTYDAVVCHNVLNVLPEPDRTEAVKRMFDSVKSGGHIIIGVRSSMAISGIKQFDPSDEAGAKWVKKSGGRFSYQKGFQNDELANYIQKFANENGYKTEIKSVKAVSNVAVDIKVISK